MYLVLFSERDEELSAHRERFMRHIKLQYLILLLYIEYLYYYIFSTLFSANKEVLLSMLYSIMFTERDEELLAHRERFVRHIKVYE